MDSNSPTGSFPYLKSKTFGGGYPKTSSFPDGDFSSWTRKKKEISYVSLWKYVNGSSPKLLMLMERELHGWCFFPKSEKMPLNLRKYRDLKLQLTKWPK